MKGSFMEKSSVFSKTLNQDAYTNLVKRCGKLFRCHYVALRLFHCFPGDCQSLCAGASPETC